MISGYRLMGTLVMFDLPVITKHERQAATVFRKRLLDMGFFMCQYSVYIRFCTSSADVASYTRKVKMFLPASGHVSILVITDAQYKRILNFYSRQRSIAKNIPNQLELF